MGFERGFTKEVYFSTLKILPIMWIIVILLVRLVAGPLVGKIMPKFVGQTDGFNARVLLNTLLNVTVFIDLFNDYRNMGRYQNIWYRASQKLFPYLATKFCNRFLD